MKTIRCIAAIVTTAAGITSAQVTYQWTDVTPLGGRVEGLGIHPLDGSLIIRNGYPATPTVMYSNDRGGTWNAPSSPLPYASSLFVHPGMPGTVFAGAALGALFRSDDFGRTWAGIYTPESASSIQVFGANPLDAHGAYALVTPQMGSCSYFFGCVYNGDWKIVRTQDDGAHWTTLSTLLGSRTAGYSSAIGPTPADPSRLFVWTNGSRILESRDRGVTWTDFAPPLATPLYTVAPDPLRRDVLYGQRLYFDFAANFGYNVTMRSDAGAWRELFTMYNNAPLKVIVDPARTRTLWIGPGYINGQSYVLHRSEDAGETWQTVPFLDLPASTTDFSPGGLFPAPAEPGVIYVINNYHLYRGTPSRIPDPVIVEYQYEGIRYWLTSLDGEAVSQDYRQQPGDVHRTGLHWGAWNAADAPAGAVGSCRFWPKPEVGRTRVLLQQGFECDILKRDPGWILEGENEFYTLPPANDACPAGTVAVHRFNNLKPDFNHRWVADPAVAAEMKARGWVDEGVRFCARPLGSNE